MARDLRQPKYRPQTIPNKKKVIPRKEKYQCKPTKLGDKLPKIDY